MRAGGGAMRPEREGGQESACCSKTAVLFTFALFLIDFLANFLYYQLGGAKRGNRKEKGREGNLSIYWAGGWPPGPSSSIYILRHMSLY